MARVLALLVFCAVGLYPAYKAYEFADKSCAIDTAGSVQGFTAEKGGQQQSATRQTIVQTQTNRTNDKPAKILNNGSWGKDFWCKATITDFAIAYFTYCLVIVGVFGMWSAERMTRDAERAHIFPDMHPVVVAPANTIQITITPTNNGRSAGILREVCANYSVTKPWGLWPYTGVAMDFDQVVKAGEPSVASAGFPSVILGRQYFYGYIAYLDLFRRSHKTYFCVRVNPPANLYWTDDTWHTRWLNRFY